MFNCTNNHGFQMTFDNGWTISVQFGDGNYCSNRDQMVNSIGGVYPSKTAEIAIWDKNGNDFGFDNGRGVKGWCDANEVARWIETVSKWTFENSKDVE